LKNDCDNLNQIVVDELDEQLFLFVPVERSKYWSDSPLFDEKVQKRLPKSVDDMVEAGKCLAVGRYTACVFHLMRVVEIGAKNLAKKNLRLVLTHKATLGTLIRELGAGVAKMPSGTPAETERKEAFSKTADRVQSLYCA
jgi:hypothetical protein